MVARIIAIGGGGFLTEPENTLLDRYCLEQTGKSIPKVCFIPTARGDSEDFLLRFYTAFGRYSCKCSHLSFFHQPSIRAIPLISIEENLLNQDLIYVSGGNTRSMLAVWREWNLDKILKKAWKSGVILAGMSAGAICWFKYGGTYSINNNQMSSLEGLGFIQGSCTPHYNGESNPRQDLYQLLKSRELPSGIGIDNSAAVLFQEQQIIEVVASRPKAKAYRIEVTEQQQIVEQPLKTRFLG